MREFEHDGPPRIVFGPGAATRAVAELIAAGARRVLLVSTATHRAGVDALAVALGQRCVGIFAEARPQVPHATAAAATRLARESGADWLVAHGGGTAIGTAKAVALETPISIAAIPTTYAGSEMTDIWGITADGVKKTGRDERVRPKLVLYDPDLLAALRPEIARNSLFNALAHSIEALYVDDDDIRAIAEQSIGAILAGLATADAAESLYGAMLAGKVLGRAPMALHHKLAHVLGGSFGTPHAATHAALLPYSTAFNMWSAPRAREALQRATGSAHPAGHLWDIATAHGIPTSLGGVGFGHDEVEQAISLTLMKRYANPRDLTAAGLRALLTDAIDGKRPTATP